jgi:hypothetical protein
VKSSRAANDTLIDRTRAVWQRRLGCDLSREDARQIAENVTGFFAVLAEWSRTETPVPANDTDNPSISIPARCTEGLGGRKAGGNWTARHPAHDDHDGGGE